MLNSSPLRVTPSIATNMIVSPFRGESAAGDTKELAQGIAECLQRGAGQKEESKWDQEKFRHRRSPLRNSQFWPREQTLQGRRDGVQATRSDAGGMASNTAECRTLGGILRVRDAAEGREVCL